MNFIPFLFVNIFKFILIKPKFILVRILISLPYIILIHLYCLSYFHSSFYPPNADGSFEILIQVPGPFWLDFGS